MVKCCSILPFFSLNQVRNNLNGRAIPLKSKMFMKMVNSNLAAISFL